ncbi:hypothetical protein O3P69_013919 [Scylla paramamosain]|uniref:Uncharacterized protein n=1 Tax=Scylla paramamosain TaxID=85552 RepID=A0AAW0SQD5_SCYPA
MYATLARPHIWTTTTLDEILSPITPTTHHAPCPPRPATHSTHQSGGDGWGWSLAALTPASPALRRAPPTVTWLFNGMSSLCDDNPYKVLHSFPPFSLHPPFPIPTPCKRPRVVRTIRHQSVPALRWRLEGRGARRERESPKTVP